MIKYLLIFLFATTMMASCGSSKKTTKTTKPEVHDELSRYPLNFMRSEYLSTVLDEAQKEKKLVFVDMYADWCAPCKVMDEELYMNEDFSDIINKDFISYKVNVEKDNGSHLGTIFSVEVLPTILFLDAEGNVLQRSDGALSYSQFLEMAARAVEASR
ncbi:MAG TPA: DUF255 domain-containing protein [Saprospiraceae bacterium]|nr:DUF255 domain-containing protein [Saprospiraceae bacterium]